MQVGLSVLAAIKEVNKQDNWAHVRDSRLIRAHMKKCTDSTSMRLLRIIYISLHSMTKWGF